MGDAIRKGIDPLAIGTELRLGQVTRENAATKANRYLISGRINIRSVDEDHVFASVRGDSGHTHRIAQQNGEWSCSCPVRGDCSHLIAVKRVVIRPGSPKGGRT